MITSICPVCGFTLEPDARSCPNCRVDLALAAALAEDMVSSSVTPVKIPITPEVLVPRLGEKLVQRGMITDEDLATALRYQQEQAALGKPVLLGQALLYLGFIDRSTLDQTITAQILDLQAALNRTNRDLERRVEEYTADLQHALQKLSELHQLKSNFVSNISHELRTPLTHIKGYLELLTDETLGPLTPEQADAGKVMARAVERLENLINDLIKFSETAKGGLFLRLTAVSLPKLIPQIIARHSDKAKKREVTLHTHFPSHLPEVQADKENLTWVISQLTDNAIKFTPPGGRVTLAGEADGQYVTISVTDTGIGIPQERIDEIFLPFHQLDNSPRRHYGGTGMGLSLVKRILEAHNAPLRVESAVGKGSRFQFSLPIHETSQAAPRTGRAAPPAPAPTNLTDEPKSTLL